MLPEIPENEADTEVSRKAFDDEDLNSDDSQLLAGGYGSSKQGSAFMDARPQEGVTAGNRRSARKWDNRQFQGLDDEIELGTRNIKMALRRLRQFAREGSHDEFDLEGTISSTARNAGWLDIKMRPERRNKVKVLILFDMSGSMKSHVKQCEELFSAVKSEFKQLEYFYFHNCIYDIVWRYDGPSVHVHYPLRQIMNKYGKDYKLIIVGDATMYPADILDAGQGLYRTSTQYSGETWTRSLLAHYRHAVWLNPENEQFWHSTQSIQIIREIMENRMYPLTLSGLDEAMKSLSR